MADTAEQENELIKCVRKLLNPEDPQAKECKSCACTVKEFFEAIGKTVDKKGSPVTIKVRIPAYQRPYAWDVREVNQLIQDLETKASTESPYHLGTIILHYDKEGEKTFNVVDGQQRLRTFEMLLKRGEKESEGKIEVCGEGKITNEVKNLCGDKSASVKSLLECGTIVCLIVQNIDEAFHLFETQNGRGKPLSVENLLKAYHYHEMTHGDFSQRPTKERLYELERQWETEVVEKQEDELHGGKTSVLSKHLLLARHWSRGAEKPKIGRHLGEARVPYLDEYKGLTLNPESAPLQNPWVLCRMARLLLSDEGGYVLTPKSGLLQTPGDLLHMAGSLLVQTYLAPRKEQVFGDSSNLPLDPFVTICQPIINGDAFFEYVVTFEQMTRCLFKAPLSLSDKDFRAFQVFYRVVKNKKADISKHARVVYETFLLLTFDRFGLKGVKSLYLDLWLLAYYERITKYSLRYDSAGKAYGKDVCILLANEASLSKVASEINKLKQNAVDNILKSDEKIKNYFRDRWTGVAPITGTDKDADKDKEKKNLKDMNPAFTDLDISNLENCMMNKFSDLLEEAKKVSEANNPDQNQE